MKVLIIGGGKTGSQLAETLLYEGHQVKIIEERCSVYDKMNKLFPADTLLLGDGSSPSVLESAGIDQVNVLVAVTGEDETNLVISTLAHFEFKVPRIIARINNPRNAWLYTKEMGVDVALNQTDILARLIIEEMSLGDMMTLLKLRKGEYSVVEEKVHPDSVALGKKVKELPIPSECVIMAIIRSGNLLIPHGDTKLEKADEIIALVHAGQAVEFEKILAANQLL